MAWTAPMTFVANTVLTAAQLNTYLRDNMFEIAPAKATATGGYFISTGKNAVVERHAQQQHFKISAATTYTSGTQLSLLDGERTESTSYADLATIGPSVTATTGTKAMVIIGAELLNAHQSASRMTVDVTGASNIAGTDSRAVTAGVGEGRRIGASLAIWYNALTPGANTFTCKYRVSGGMGAFQNRRITVLPY